MFMAIYKVHSRGIKTADSIACTNITINLLHSLHEKYQWFTIFSTTYLNHNNHALLHIDVLLAYLQTENNSVTKVHYYISGFTYLLIF